MFFFIIGLYFAINIWIVVWFWRRLKESGWVRYVVCPLIAVLTLLYPYFFRNSGASGIELFLLWISALWMGTFFYTFVLTLLADLVLWLVKKFTPEKPKKKGRKKKGEKEKHTLKPVQKACIGVGILSLLICWCGWYNANHPVLTEYTLTVDLPEGAPEHLEGKVVTVGMMSDIHLGRLISTEKLDRGVELLARCRPDIVLLPGDVLDDHILLDIPAIRESLAKLKAPMGVWASLGNHEYHSGNVVDSIDILKKCGIRLLIDNYQPLGNSFVLIGRNDYSARRLAKQERTPLAEIINRMPVYYKKLPMIVMDHQPQKLEEAEQAGIALEVSGHTHNGQLWPANYIVDAIYENAFGHSKRGSTHYIVSNGLGTWGPPVRTSSRPEVVFIRLYFKKTS